MDSLPPHPAIDRADKCGVTEIINGREWICIKKVHDDPPRDGHGQKSQKWDRHGFTPRGVPTYPPKSIRHLFVRRWPGTDH